MERVSGKEKEMKQLKCKLGFHNWAKCIHPDTHLYLYGQKFCTRCRKQSCGYTEKEIEKGKSLIAKHLVFL